jgi:CheY-like chemotaxis protein
MPHWNRRNAARSMRAYRRGICFGGRLWSSILERQTGVWAVVTDVQMPGSIDGLKLAHLIRIRWPKVKIIVTSGQVRLREDDMPTGCQYLHKPYGPSQLIGILEAWVTSE